MFKKNMSLWKEINLEMPCEHYIFEKTSGMPNENWTFLPKHNLVQEINSHTQKFNKENI